MTATTPNPYLRTKVMTASPAELRLMLLDGAIRFLRQGIDGLEARDHEASFHGLTRCQKIVLELISALCPEHAPELCGKISGLYTYMYLKLVEACTGRDVAIAREVLGLLEYERTTWQMLMEQQGATAETPGGAVETTAAPDREGEGLVGTQVSVRG